VQNYFSLFALTIYWLEMTLITLQCNSKIFQMTDEKNIRTGKVAIGCITV